MRLIKRRKKVKRPIIRYKPKYLRKERMIQMLVTGKVFNDFLQIAADEDVSLSFLAGRAIKIYITAYKESGK